MPFHIKRPSRIFVADMGDLFFEGVSMTDLTDIFEVMARCPQHIFLVLTKRPERMATLWHDLGTGVAYRCEQEKQKKFWPLPNVQIGTSVEDQKSYDERVPWLLRIPALVRFVSAEPLLEDIDIHLDDCLLEEDHYETYERLQWVIIGGESGPLARPCNVEWIRSLRDQCVAAGIAMHIKQLGRVPVIASARGQGPEDLWPLGTSFGNSTHDVSLNGRVALLRDHKGSDPSEWPEDLRVRQWPA